MFAPESDAIPAPALAFHRASGTGRDAFPARSGEDLALPTPMWTAWGKPRGTFLAVFGGGRLVGGRRLGLDCRLAVRGRRLGLLCLLSIACRLGYSLGGGGGALEVGLVLRLEELFAPLLVALEELRLAFASCLLLCALGRLHGLELLLGRKLPALRDDERLDLDPDVLEDVDCDLVAADPLDRVGEVDLSAVDPDLASAPELVGDVGRRHRAKQRPARSGVHVEAEDGLAEGLRDLLRLLEAPGLVARALGLPLLELGHLRGRRRLGETPWLEVVPHEPARDVHDLAAQADLVDVLQEDDVHQRFST